MEFIQSRFQDVFSRLYEMVCHVIWYIIFAVVFSLAFKAEIDFFSSLIIILIITLAPILYLLLTQQGGTKVIRISDDKFVYSDANTVSEFSWDNFQGFKVSKTQPYQVIIKNNVHGKTRFGYYAFSSKQRKEIFDALQSKEYKVESAK